MLKIQRVWGPVKSLKPQLLCVETTRDHTLHVCYFQFPQLAKILTDRPYFHLFKKETALRVTGSLAVTAAWEMAEQALTQRSWPLPCTPGRRPGRGQMTPCRPRAHLRGRGSCHVSPFPHSHLPYSICVCIWPLPSDLSLRGCQVIVSSVIPDMRLCNLFPWCQSVHRTLINGNSNAQNTDMQVQGLSVHVASVTRLSRNCFLCSFIAFDSLSLLKLYLAMRSINNFF